MMIIRLLLQIHYDYLYFGFVCVCCVATATVADAYRYRVDVAARNSSIEYVWLIEPSFYCVYIFHLCVQCHFVCVFVDDVRARLQ